MAGIHVSGGGDNRIDDNYVEGFDNGIVIEDSPGTTARRNTVKAPPPRHHEVQLASELNFKSSLRSTTGRGDVATGYLMAVCFFVSSLVCVVIFALGLDLLYKILLMLVVVIAISWAVFFTTRVRKAIFVLVARIKAFQENN